MLHSVIRWSGRTLRMVNGKARLANVETLCWVLGLMALWSGTRLCEGRRWGSLGKAWISLARYTGCPRSNGQNFGRVFLMLKYTDITQNTYVQSWTVTEIKAREKYGLFAVPRTIPGSRDVIPIRCALSVLVYSWLKRFPRCDCTCKMLGNPKDNYDVSASVFVVQFNGFMSLTS